MHARSCKPNTEGMKEGRKRRKHEDEAGRSRVREADNRRRWLDYATISSASFLLLLKH
jgi:hypothetical protein